MDGDLGGVVIDEVADAVMGDAAELGPLAEGADRGLAAGRKDAGGAETDDVGELGADAGSGIRKRVHAPSAMSRDAVARARKGTKKPAPVRARAEWL